MRLQHLSIGHFPDADRHRGGFGYLRCAVTLRPENNLKAVILRAHEQRRKNAIGTGAGCEPFQERLIEMAVRIGGGLEEGRERNIAVLGGIDNSGIHGEAPIPIESCVKAQAGTLPIAPA